MMLYCLFLANTVFLHTEFQIYPNDYFQCKMAFSLLCTLYNFLFS